VRGRIKGGVHFTSEGSFGGFEEVCGIVLGEFKGIGDGVEGLHGQFTGLIEAICNANGVNSTFDEFFCLFEEGSGEDDDTGRSIANFVVLGFGELNEEFGDLVFDLHLS
jgi:hypothetical protein